ncbi:hypothetical protein ACG2LH_15330 [Zhouia sp. PK063]|uniref:hypothetical protein n=1 Tax=Zhouia sp. PK063 TaxID=3373602 RepID=UPI00378AB945
MNHENQSNQDLEKAIEKWELRETFLKELFQIPMTHSVYLKEKKRYYKKLLSHYSQSTIPLERTSYIKGQLRELQHLQYPNPLYRKLHHIWAVIYNYNGVIITYKTRQRRENHKTLLATFDNLRIPKELLCYSEFNSLYKAPDKAIAYRIQKSEKTAIRYTLHFHKTTAKKLTELSGYTATLEQSDGSCSTIFRVAASENITTQQAFELLSGRSIFQSIPKKCWITLRRSKENPQIAYLKYHPYQEQLVKRLLDKIPLKYATNSKEGKIVQDQLKNGKRVQLKLANGCHIAIELNIQHRCLSFYLHGQKITYHQLLYSR